MLDSQRATRLGIITTGKAYLDRAPSLVGCSASMTPWRQPISGFGLYKVALSWPLEPEGMRCVSPQGLEEILVVEEKRGFVEDQLVQILYRMDAVRRPRVVGKRDQAGAPLLPSEGEFGPTVVARALIARLAALGAVGPELERRLARLEALERGPEGGSPRRPERQAFFCSGCPHNASTRVPDGSRALAGIGCHGMAMTMPERRTAVGTHMGGEGGALDRPEPLHQRAARLSESGRRHLPAQRPSRAARRCGRRRQHHLQDPPQRRGRHDRGAAGRRAAVGPRRCPPGGGRGGEKVVVVSEDPSRYAGTARELPDGAEVRHRRELDQVQRDLSAMRGLTVLIYDQTCAAERRRRRKRGLEPDPATRVFINAAICEGCGDCSTASNCISVKPLETELGQKRTIDQSNCNKDLSCLDGFCPSMVTVHGGRPRRLDRPGTEHDDLLGDLPLPEVPTLDRPYSILIAGIGGTGILTISALLGMAAHLEGKACTVLDFTGLAQKNGAVTSHVRLAPSAADLHAVRLAPGGADLVLGCDLVTAASEAGLSRMAKSATRALVNSDVQPTAAFVIDGDAGLDGDAMRGAIEAACGAERVEQVEATSIATALMGDAIATNVFLLGFAFQMGNVPLGLAALMRAIELNGVAVADTRRSFAWGRLAAHDPRRVEAILDSRPRGPQPALGLEALVEDRAARLAAYQDHAYADRYRRLVAGVAEAESRLGWERAELPVAVAHGLFKLMAYKDEYEVARLIGDGCLDAEIRRQMEGDLRLEFHLVPPFLARRDPATGRPLKRSFGLG